MQIWVLSLTMNHVILSWRHIWRAHCQMLEKWWKLFNSPPIHSKSQHLPAICILYLHRTTCSISILYHGITLVGKSKLCENSINIQKMHKILSSKFLSLKKFEYTLIMHRIITLSFLNDWFSSEIDIKKSKYNLLCQPNSWKKLHIYL